jgi:hypothetical protein
MLVMCELLKGLEISPSRFLKVLNPSPPSLSPFYHNLCILSITDVKNYYTHHMPYVSAQPRVREDILASLLEKNANDYAIQQEWEAEWNQYGLSSRLSEEVWKSVAISFIIPPPPIVQNFVFFTDGLGAAIS